MFKYTGKQEWLNEALPEAMDNAMDAMKKYGLVIFTEANQPMRFQQDDLETLAYFIDKYKEATDLIYEGEPECAHRWLQRLEHEIDFASQSLDVVWENTDGELDTADDFLQRMAEGATKAVKEECNIWGEEA